MKKESLEFLKGLISSISPSGYEQEAADIWRKRTGKYVQQIKGDVHGNSIAVLNKDNKFKVMLAGHVDEIGYMVKYIDNNGYIFFSAIGGIDNHLVPGQRVWIKTQKGRILGVIGKQAIHLTDHEKRKKTAGFEELWIDIGTESKAKTQKYVEIGDVAVPAVEFEFLKGDLAVGRSFDDKAGAFVVSETMRRLAEKKKIAAAVYGIATVQEEIGLRGAKTSAYGVSPDVGIAVDVTFASDFPGTERDKKRIGEIKIGGGVVIARGPNINPKLHDLLVKTAKAQKIPYQIQAISRATGTDANPIQLTKDSVATGLISIPLRYMHTPVEVISLKDLESASSLLVEVLSRLNKNVSFVI
jgi:endoglucanase